MIRPPGHAGDRVVRPGRDGAAADQYWPFVVARDIEDRAVRLRVDQLADRCGAPRRGAVRRRRRRRRSVASRRCISRRYRRGPGPAARLLGRPALPSAVASGPGRGCTARPESRRRQPPRPPFAGDEKPAQFWCAGLVVPGWPLPTVSTRTTARQRFCVIGSNEDCRGSSMRHRGPAPSTRRGNQPPCLSRTTRAA